MALNYIFHDLNWKLKTVLYLNRLGAEPTSEGCLGFRFLGAPEGSGRPAGERVHPTARLGPPGCCIPALPCRTATQIGQHWWLPVCCFWLQYCAHAHWLLKLSHVWMCKNWLKYSSLSLCGPTWSQHLCVLNVVERTNRRHSFKNPHVEPKWVRLINLHSFFDAA